MYKLTKLIPCILALSLGACASQPEPPDLPKLGDGVILPSLNSVHTRTLVKTQADNMGQTCNTITNAKKDTEWNGGGLKYVLVCDSNDVYYWFSQPEERVLGAL